MVTFDKLYKYTTIGQAQQWQIKVDGNKYWTEEGIVGGTITTSSPTFCYGKNVGRSNQTTDDEQAVLEARSKHQKKLDKGYNVVLTTDKPYFEPMLAHDAKKSKDITFKKRTFVQPKLDGLRTINQNNTLMSRNGKPFVTCPHLHQDKVILDGELYNHEYKEDFNKIVSLVKKTKPTDADVEEAKQKVQMWVYDFPGVEGVFSQRYEALWKWFLVEHGVKMITSHIVKPICSETFLNNMHSYSTEGFVLVPTYEVQNWYDVNKWHEVFIEQGFEGTIIRIDIGNYEGKRSKQLLKYKDFVDEEFEIVGYEEGTGGRAGTIGFFVMKHDKEEDKTFKSNIKGDFEFLAQVWKERDKYVGTRATVKYFSRTPKKENGDGDVPRFPFIIKLNREEYE